MNIYSNIYLLTVSSTISSRLPGLTNKQPEQQQIYRETYGQAASLVYSTLCRAVNSTMTHEIYRNNTIEEKQCTRVCMKHRYYSTTLDRKSSGSGSFLPRFVICSMVYHQPASVGWDQPKFIYVIPRETPRCNPKLVFVYYIYRSE